MKEEKTDSIRMIALTGLLFVQAAAAYVAWNEKGTSEGILFLMVTWLVYCLIGYFFFVVVFLIIHWLDQFNLKGKWTGIIFFLIIPIIFLVYALIFGE